MQIDQLPMPTAGLDQAWSWGYLTSEIFQWQNSSPLASILFSLKLNHDETKLTTMCQNIQTKCAFHAQKGNSKIKQAPVANYPAGVCRIKQVI